ncbi:MAG: UbiA family prenyltransferase [Verrucomicrobiales bacterium]
MIEYIKICRIDHWLKNVFILFGHVVALVLYYELELPPGFILTALLSLVPACLVASSYYILNEILDAPYDALHPVKKLRGIPAGKVRVPILWAVMAGLLVSGLALAWALFDNRLYFASLALLMLCALLYNLPPMRLKDKAFLDVISESINNPLRLLLGWYAVVPEEVTMLPPLSIILAWWFFGALLMTGKRYSEYRFINNDGISGDYRRSFRIYTEQRLIMAMIGYACLFCFCTGIAMTVYQSLNNLVMVFPAIMLALMAYFRHAMKEETARLEPEQLLRNPLIIATTILTGALSIWLLYAQKHGWFNSMDVLYFMETRWEKLHK